jgi:ABC-type branched-subunit amino acid transport system substrate-binding protein
VGAIGTAMLVAACGTTVPMTRQVTVRDSGSTNPAAGASGGGAGAASGSAVDGSAGAGGVGASAVGAGAGGQAVATGGAGHAGPAGAAPVAAGISAPRAAVDRTPVKVGAFYLNGGNAVMGAGFAATPVNFGDGQLEAKAVVADINAHGGIGGRPIELYLQKIEAADASKPAAFDAACSALAQDKKVFAIMSMFNLRSPLAACAAKYKVILIDAALGAGDDDVYRTYGDWAFTPSQMSLDTEQKLVLRNAASTGAINSKTLVGVLVQNDDDIFPRVLRNTIEPTLDAMHIPHEAAVIASASDSSGIANAILKFQTDGVKTVMFSAGNGGIPEVLFMQAADQQRYAPSYIMGDSTDTWFVGSSAPASQAQNIIGVGSYPIANVNADQVPSNPLEQHCLDVISKAGEPVSDRHSSLTATFYCETFYGFAAAGARVQGPMTADAWRAAYRSLGPAYPTLMSFEVDVSKNFNAGARAYRTLAWNPGCGCIAYTSGLQRLP